MAWSDGIRMSSIKKKERTTLKKVRRNLRNQSIATGVPTKQKDMAIKVLDESGLYPEIVKKVRSCSRRYPCNSKWCDQCSNARRTRYKRYVAQEDMLKEGRCNATGTALGTLSSNYRVRAGQRMVKHFDGLPLILLHAVTINLALCDLDENLSELVGWYRKQLRPALARLNTGAIARGKFDMVLKYADGTTFHLPDGDLSESLQGHELPHERIGMLHIHFVAFDPSLSHAELRGILVDAFPGAQRVCVKRSYEDNVFPDGTVTRGVQGFLEYLSMEKVEVAFGSESVDAVLEFAKLDSTWTRPNRNYSFGVRDNRTVDLIDHSRVTELETELRRQRIKDGFKDLDYANRWLHKWMSNATVVLDQVKRFRRNVHRFRCYLQESYLRFNLG